MTTEQTLTWEARCIAQRLAKYFHNLKLLADTGKQIHDHHIRHISVDTLKLARVVRKIRTAQQSTTDRHPGG